MLSLHSRGSNASLTSNSFWNKFKSKNKEPDLREKQAQMALTRTRLLTLAFGEMETIRTVRPLLFLCIL